MENGLLLGSRCDFATGGGVAASATLGDHLSESRKVFVLISEKKKKNEEVREGQNKERRNRRKESGGRRGGGG